MKSGIFVFSSTWCHQESNRGHKDFQSFALPTELWHLALDCECKVIAFCRIHQIFSQLFFKKINNCDKMCEGWAWRLQGAYLRHAFLDISAIPAPRMAPRPPHGAAQHPGRGGCTATHHLRGAILLGDFVPRMSPRPRVAKYGATHGANHLRGWRLHSLWSSSPHRWRSSDGFPVGRRYKDTTQIVVKFGEIAISGTKTIFNVVFRRIFAPRTL